METEEIKTKEKNKALSFIGSFLKCIAWAVLIILVILAIFLIYYVVMAKQANKNGVKYKPPMALYTIVSPSMEPNINVYDVVLSLRTDAKDLKKGDIITFYSTDDDLNGITITHRIIKVTKTNTGYLFTTKGDNNVQTDEGTTTENDVIGKVSLRVPQLGRIQFFLASKGGWIIAILIPALAVISYDIVKLFKMFKLKSKIKKQKAEELANINKTPPTNTTNINNNNSNIQ